MQELIHRSVDNQTFKSFSHEVKMKRTSLKTLIILSSFVNLVLCFCGNPALHGKMAETAIKVSNWLRDYHRDDVTRLEPHLTSAMISALRLVGYQPRTILWDFKNSNSYNIVDYIRSYLDNNNSDNERQRNSSSNLKAGHIASIFQAVSTLCYNPEDFYIHDMKKALLEGFKSFTHITCGNSYEYGSTALAVCQSLGTSIGANLVRDILTKLNETCLNQTCTNIPDTLAINVMALSCLRRNLGEVGTSQRTVDKVIERYSEAISKAFRQHKDKQWNVQSKGLLVQAITSLPKRLRPRHWHCKGVMAAILDEYDDANAFGNVLASIQILPALVGKSLVDLKMSCPSETQQIEEVQISKEVCVKLVVKDPAKKGQTEMLDPVVVKVPEKTSAYEILQYAADVNAKYKFEVLQTSYGRMITSICDVKQDPSTGYYWSLYESESLQARDGVDLFIPTDNSCIIFKYERCAAESNLV